MIELFDEFVMYLRFPFVQRAFAVGALISVCASLLGVTLVLRRCSFIGDGLSHVAFGAMAISGALGATNDMTVVMPIALASAVLILRAGQSARIKGDAAIAMFSVGALAIGYLVMNRWPRSGNLAGDVCQTLFGTASILTLSNADVVICAAVSIFVIAFYAVAMGKIFCVTFDEQFASACGVDSRRYGLVIALVTAAVVSLAIKLAGTLLVSALVVFPACSAMRIFKSFKAVTIAAGIMSALCSIFGTAVSILAGTPVGSTVVAAHIVIFAACWLIGRSKEVR